MRSTLWLIAVLSSASALWADTIYTLDGKKLEDVTLLSESVTEVVYKAERGSESRLPSDQVLAVEFSKKPKKVDEADTLVGDGSLEAAVDAYQEYLDEVLGSDPEKRYKWAPAYAAKRVVELKLSLGNLPGAVSSVDSLLKNFPDSRYAPQMHLAKIGALNDQGEPRKAQVALDDFKKLIDTKQLSPAWSLQHQLASIASNDQLKAVERRDALSRVVDAAKDFPLVKSRALVMTGESFLAEASPEASESARTKALNEARKVFESVISDPAADQNTLAGAYTGLGDCLFQAAAGKRDVAVLKDAVLSYMRVIELYPEQSRYVAKCLFLGGRALQLTETQENRVRALKLHDRCIRDFPDSNWAKQSSEFRGK